jgi:hypothetical protein
MRSGMTRRFLALLLVLFPAEAFAQRDFLTADEVDQVRLAQEPNMRLQLYIKFAQQRVALIEQAVAQEKSGRSRLIHDLLEDYTKIIEAIDTVSDDALKRKVDISVGTKAVADANQEMLTKLEKVRESEPKDISRYQFALDQAIDTTRDSAELAQEDLQKRSTDVQVKAKKELDEREAIMKPEEVAAKRQEEKKAAETKRKAPTLRRKGEVVKEQQ